MKEIRCHNCGKTFEIDPDNPQVRWRTIAAGAAVGAVAGSVLPGVGTGLGAMMGVRGAYSAEKNYFACPRCGQGNDINNSFRIHLVRCRESLLLTHPYTLMIDKKIAAHR